MNSITAEASNALRAVFADPLAGMTEQELDRIARGQPLPEGPCHNRDTCESYARENRDGLLLEAQVQHRRGMKVHETRSFKDVLGRMRSWFEKNF